MNIIITHENGDFDALAAVVAAAKLFTDSAVIMPEPLQPNVRSFINLYRDLLPLIDPRDIGDDIEKVIVIDTNRRERLGKWSYLLDKAKTVIVYDHHPGDEDLGADKSVIEEVGATTTLMLEEIRQSKIELTDFEATLFTIGIYEDTGCLTYDISTVRDAHAVAYLWEHDINTRLIQEYLKSPLSEIQKELFEKMIRESELHEINNRRVLISATELDEYVIGASVLLHLLDEIEDAGITIVIIKMGDNIYLAARSRADDLNLLELLSPFEVKGYPGAVSAHIKGLETKILKKKVLDHLKEILPPALTAAQVASKPVFTIRSDTTISDADDLLNENNFKGCPVIEEGKLVGIISRRDLRKGLRSDLGHAPVKGFMNRRLITASPDHSLTQLRRLMVEYNIGRVPIVDTNNDLIGIVTRTDILRYLSYIDHKGQSIKAKKTANYKTDSAQRLDHGYYSSGGSINILPLIDRELSHNTKKLLRQAGQLGENENVKVYLVGGIIRDLLLKYPLEKDLDFVVIGDAVAFAYKLQKVIGGVVRHFERFKTASIVMKEGFRLDLVTARKEYYLSPAALPRVESSGLKDDLFRRDFTINAMACSLVSDNFGRLYDFYNGRYDLEKKLIRVLNEQSFTDDPLRILRAIRFEQRYDFTIEEKTMQLAREAIKNKFLNKVGRQRLNQELRLVYRELSPVKVLKRFDQLQLIPFLYPGAAADRITWQYLSRIEDILNWASNLKWDRKPDRELVYLGGFLFRLESVKRSAIIKKLYISREKSKILLEAFDEIPAVYRKLDWSELNPSQIAAFLEGLPIETLLLAYAIYEEGHVKEHLKQYIINLRNIQPEFDGSDLKNMGLRPGPLYRKIIERLKQAVLDGEVSGFDQEREFVINYLSNVRRKEGE
ncbi:MAG: CBS domain-containing protein [Bacillota bacterium]|nr:CBS domain-containing protein [Bacillota bacterium]